MAKVLRTEQVWKAGILSKPKSDENLLRDAISNVLKALQRNVESKRSRYKDKVLPYVFSMNTYWYIYMRTRNTELGKILGELYMKKNYKVVAEESAYLYQKQAWGGPVRLLDKEELGRINNEGIGGLVKGKMEAFMKGFDEISQRHKSNYSIPDVDLRRQIKEAIIKLVMPAHTEFLDTYSSVLQVKLYLSPDSIEGLLNQIFGGSDRLSEKNMSFRRKEFKDRSEGRNLVSSEQNREVKDFRRSKSNTTDA
ncbi:hypothetical protein LguiA_006568 [Lonicera macranthoides]